MKSIQRLVTYFLLIITIAKLQSQSHVNESQNLESFGLTIAFDRIGQKSFIALYDEQTQGVFLPVYDIFDFLKIFTQSQQEGKLLTGFINNEKSPFTIDAQSNQIKFQSKTTQTTGKELIYDMGVLYVSSKKLEEAFGFQIGFDFRSLSATMKADFEFPLVRHQKLENARANLKRWNGEIHYNDSLERKYHLFRFGMVDWSITAMQGLINENRIGVATGAELLGGEASVWLNYSDVFGLNRNLQRYHWRWVNNDARLFRQVQVGRLNSQSIASLLNPVDGVTITNAPSTIRKALGTYLISDYAEPNWLVELYINNVLIDYTTTDASGFFRFEVPITYGTTQVMLRYYGPNGEERAEEKTYHMPYHFLPKGEFEYRITGGTVLNAAHSPFGRADFSYGFGRGLTVGAGVEYSQTIVGNSPFIPFVTASVQPLSQLILVAEYAHGVRSRFLVNYTLPGNTILELNHALYDKDQTAIVFNYLSETVARLSLPFQTKKFSGLLRTSFRQFQYENFAFNSAEAILSTFAGKVNVNLGNHVSWTSNANPFYYTHLSASYRFPRQLNVRASAQYDVTNTRFISLRSEVEKPLFHNAMITLGYENQFQTASHNINLTFRYDLSFLSAFASANITNRRLMSTQSARGSFAFNTGNNYIHADKNPSVGRSGVTLKPFVDVNHNRIHDQDEPHAENLHVRSNGGQMVVREKDHLRRIHGLEPFVGYGLTIDNQGFESLSWNIKDDLVHVVTDPNQFKIVAVPISPMGEVYGNVVDETEEGVGRILIHIKDKNDSTVATTLSESDGFFSYLGLTPESYTVAVDSQQLSILNMTANTLDFTIQPTVDGDVVNAGNIILRRVSLVQPTDTLVSQEVRDTLKVEVVDSIKVDRTRAVKSFDTPVLFDFDKSVIRDEHKDYLREIAQVLVQHPCITVQIEAHACALGTHQYNQLLSERRARSVQQFMAEQGVSSSRIAVVGFGETRPVNNNANKVERSLNRRATFTNTSGSDCKLDFDLIFGAVFHSKSQSVSESEPSRPAAKEGRRIYQTIRNTQRGALPSVIVMGESEHYQIQVASFSNRKNAEALVRQLHPLVDGKNVTIQESHGIFRVIVDQFKTLQEAKGLAQHILHFVR